MAKDTVTKQKGKKDDVESKSSKDKKTAEPKADPKPEVKQDADPAPKQTKGKKAAEPKTEVKAEVKQEAAPTKQAKGKKAAEPVKQAKGKKAAEPAKKAKAVKKGGAKKEQEDGDDEEGKKRSRSFRSIYTGPDGEVVEEGRYCGIKPKQAACKALTGIFKTYKLAGKKSPTDIKFGVVETTRHSKHKKYWYTGGRLKLDAPVEVTIKKGSKENTIVYKFNNVVKKITEDECAELANCEAKQVAGAKKAEPAPKTKKVKAEPKAETKDEKPVKVAKGAKAAKPASKGKDKSDAKKGK